MKASSIFLLLTAAASLLFVGPARAAAKSDPEAEQAIIKLEHDLAEAYVKADAPALDRIEADDYTYTGADGSTETKADEIQSVKTGVLKLTECKLEDLKVRLYGKTAVVLGIANVKGTARGQDISGRYRFTDVLVRKKDKWRVVSTHESMIGPRK